MIDDRDIASLQKIRDNCGACGGRGYTLEHKENGYEIHDCICVQTIADHVKYIEANIPTQYRSWHINQIRQDIRDKSENKKYLKEVFDFLEHIPEAIEEGAGLWFCAPPGLAKSSMITYILKEAIKQGYNAYWSKAYRYVDMKLRASRGDKEAAAILRNAVESCHIIAIEEVDKVHLYSEQEQLSDSPNKFGFLRDHLFFEFLSDLYDSNVSILVSSNLPRPKVEDKYPSHVRDRLRKLKDVVLNGRTGR